MQFYNKISITESWKALFNDNNKAMNVLRMVVEENASDPQALRYVEKSKNSSESGEIN